ncbi:MAG TPA: hypothetical protein VHQ90_24470 [Thermoanaerobaculia bacterium]|nr:hypothetical protein [Thermoanaerobaculia bacterium]
MGRFSYGRGSLALCLLALLPAAAVSPVAAQITVTSADGQQSARIGLLGQLQAEALDTPDGQHSQDNLFFRRIRISASYKYGEKLTAFAELDSPNLGKGNPDGSKNATDVFFQHFEIVYAFSHQLHLEGGLIFTPNSYNHNQSSATLLGIDFGPYTFVESAPLGSRNGRDYGAEVRGYLAGDHLEYRAGVFQGVRGKSSANALRTAGRLAVYLWGAETGVLYRGTSFGKLATLSLGASYDIQKSYHSYTGDLFFEQPVAGGDGVTIQADYTLLDGKDFITALPKQKDLFAEAGYYFHAIKLQPFFQYARQDFSVAKQNDEHRAGVGLAYYFDRHNSDLKLQWTEIDHRGVKKRKDVVLQYQLWIPAIF